METGWVLDRVEYIDDSEEKPTMNFRLVYDPPHLEKEII